MIIEFTAGSSYIWIGIILIIIGSLITIRMYFPFRYWEPNDFSFVIIFGIIGLLFILGGLNMDYGFLVFKMIEP